MTTQTPAQQAGIILNSTRLQLVDWAGNDRTERDKALVWLLVEDDKTFYPYFSSECGTEVDRCFGVSEMAIVKPLPFTIVPSLPRLGPAYTSLQLKAIDTFQFMYDAALLSRSNQRSALNSDYGICDNIDRFAAQAGANGNQMSEVKENLIRKTAIYSGSYTYPVPCPEGGDASNAFTRHRNKWEGAYGLNRLNQLGQLIELIKSSEWSDDLILRKTPAFRNGLVLGDLVSYTRHGSTTLWVFRSDDESMSPSFHRVNDKDDYADLDLNYVVKLNKADTFKARSVKEFLSEMEEQEKIKSELSRKIAELQKQLDEASNGIAMLEYGLADQHKVQRIRG